MVRHPRILDAIEDLLGPRRGALLAALEPPDGATSPAGLAGHFTFAYREPSGEQIAEEVPSEYGGEALDARGQWYVQRGVARTTALALFTEAMHDAAKAYAEDPEHAEAIMRAGQDRFAADAEALADEDLPIEVSLGAALLKLIEQRAPQGTLYGP